jgi:tetratricopeptide (TPR) repeat protein
MNRLFGSNKTWLFYAGRTTQCPNSAVRFNCIYYCSPLLTASSCVVLVSSSEAEWAKSGRLLFNKRLYDQAMFCFEKADLLVERDISAAYQARKEARLLLAKSVDRQNRRAAFASTAKDFMDCATLSRGRPKQQISCYLRAAECFLQAEDFKSAAQAFFSVNEFDLAAKNFRRAGCFAEAVEVVKKCRDKMQKSLADEIIGVARLEYLRKSEYE